MTPQPTRTPSISFHSSVSLVLLGRGVHHETVHGRRSRWRRDNDDCACSPCRIAHRHHLQGFSRPPPLDSRPGEGSGPGPRRRTRTSKGDPDLEGATVGEPSGAASGGLVAHSRCHVPGGLSAARWHTHGARGSRLCTMRITPDHATPRPVCPQAMPEAVRVFRPVALAPGGLGSQRYQVWCDMRV